MKYFYEKMGERDLTIVHHIDLDGYVAANSVNLTPWGYPGGEENYRGITKEVVYMPMNYNYTWNFEALRDRDVIIVDISFTFETVKNLIKICEVAHEVRWLDHHTSSDVLVHNNEVAEQLNSIENLQYCVNPDVCGALLMVVVNMVSSHKSATFENINLVYRVRNTCDLKGIVCRNKRGEDISKDYQFICPDVIALVDMWDRFTWKVEDLGMEALYLNAAFYAVDHNLNLDKRSADSFFNMYLSPVTSSKLISIGKTISKGNERNIKAGLGSGCLVEGVAGKYKAWVYNMAGAANPNMTKEDRYAQYDCDVFICWRYTHKTHNFTYTIYAKDGINAVEIAQYYEPSGGGHKAAAGFVSNSMIFT